MRFVVAMKDNVVAWAVYYYGGRSFERRILNASSPSEALNAGVIASVLGTARRPPNLDLYDLFYIVSVDKDYLIELVDKGRTMLKNGVDFHTTILDLGYYLAPTVDGMCRSQREFFRMAEILKFKLDWVID